MDTEDDGQGNVTIVNFFDGHEHFTFDNEPDLRLFAYRFIRERIRRGKLWAINAKYDMGNVLPTFDMATEIVYRGGNFVYCRIGGVYLSDINRHLFASAETLGRLLALPKLPSDYRSVEYCRRDTEIAWRAALWLGEYYAELGTEVKCTLPSSALRLYQNRYKRIYVPQLSLSDLQWARKAYSGGRTEAFRIGKVDGPIYYVDVNSMYPWVMLREYPDLKHLIDWPNIEKEGITECLIEQDSEYPILWHRTKDKLLFPEGRFRGVWPNNELRYFLENGGSILRVYSGMHTSSNCRPLLIM